MSIFVVLLYNIGEKEKDHALIKFLALNERRHILRFLSQELLLDLVRVPKIRIREGLCTPPIEIYDMLRQPVKMKEHLYDFEFTPRVYVLLRIYAIMNSVKIY